jgi:cytidylate kinase
VNHLKLIHDFLGEKRSLEELPHTGYPFVTISRQAGAGGHLLAYVLLTDFLKLKDEELFRGWHVFDKELCEVVAKDPDLRNSVEDLLTERYRSEVFEFLESLFSGYSKHYQLYKTTFKVVRMLATLGQVIIVGRAACCVTRTMAGGVHVRLVAPESQRILWLMKRFKISKDEARRTMLKQDADRRRIIRTFFNRDIDDPLLYDVVWNTSRVPAHEITRSIIDMIRIRASGAKQAPSWGIPIESSLLLIR